MSSYEERVIEEAEKSNQVKRRQRNFIALCDNLLATFCKWCNGKGVQSGAIERVEFTSCRLCQKEGADNAAEAMHRAAHALSFAMVMSLSDRQMGKVSAQFLALQDAILMWRRHRREETEQ